MEETRDIDQDKMKEAKYNLRYTSTLDFSNYMTQRAF